MKATRKTYGGYKIHSWRPELPDHRDFRFAVPPGIQALPTHVPSVATETRIHDQGYFNSCTGNAATTALEHAMGRRGDTGQLSRMMAYYNARTFIGEEKLDDGAYIRDVFRGFTKMGVAPETNWRYNVANLFKKPTVTAMKHAEAIRQQVINKGLVYESLKTLTEIKTAIAMGQCVVFGFMVYQAFLDLSPTNFVLPMPGPNDQPIGGHAVVADGYNDALGHVFVQNSWGRAWGNDGYFNMPYEWFTDPNYLTGDFWTCRTTK